MTIARAILPLYVLTAVFLTAPLDAADTQPALQPIRYERNGGVAGTHDVVEISRTGAVVVAGINLGSGKGQLTEEQAAKLVALFATWSDLKPLYPAPPGSADGFEYKIRYGTKEVSANGLNEDLPESFKAALAAIESLAHAVTGKN